MNGVVLVCMAALGLGLMFQFKSSCIGITMTDAVNWWCWNFPVPKDRFQIFSKAKVLSSKRAAGWIVFVVGFFNIAIRMRWRVRACHPFLIEMSEMSLPVIPLGLQVVEFILDPFVGHLNVILFRKDLGCIAIIDHRESAIL
jgi:hypothetical protein